MSTSERSENPYKINIPDSKLSQLRAKLELTNFPDELDDAGWEYGAPLADIRRLTAYWKDGYDWRVHEAALNEELPQFTRDIEVEGHGTLNIHYVHLKSKVVDAVPLLFVHGWPGSFLEVRKILPLLSAASPDHPSFNVVALSLPGYGFSQAPSSKGFRGKQYAEVGNKLMLALGYNEYVTQGGDWGYFITRQIAIEYGGKHSKAWHTNMPVVDPPRLTSRPLQFLSLILSMYTPFNLFSTTERAGLERTQSFRKLGRGYMELQSTRPQTLGYSLADSPVGLLAWIYEKLVAWSDEYPWTDDEVLTWISIYWFSRPGPTASTRIYYEIHQSDDRILSAATTPKIPLGFSRFPKELVALPTSWSRYLGNVVFDSTHDSGGHFAAYEKPDELVDDLRKMFGKGGPAFGVVPGKVGYV